LILHIYLETPLSDLLVIVLWIIFSFYALLQADVRQAFSRDAPEKSVETAPKSAD